MKKFVLALAALAATLVAAASATATTTFAYQATFVEPTNGGCAPGTSCGTASISPFGHSADQQVTFNVCGFGCHVRTVTFDDGSTCNSGSHGHIGFAGLPGNPQFLEIEETIIGGTGQFEGATGSGSGTVALHGNVAIGKTSGTITLG